MPMNNERSTSEREKELEKHLIIALATLNDLSNGYPWDELQFDLPTLMRQAENIGIDLSDVTSKPAKLVNVLEMEGAVLDWASALAAGAITRDIDDFCMSTDGEHSYTTNWALAGPIIEREKIVFDFNDDMQVFTAADGVFASNGNTHLEAAMRCFVAKTLGVSVRVPEEIMEL